MGVQGVNGVEIVKQNRAASASNAAPRGGVEVLCDNLETSLDPQPTHHLTSFTRTFFAMQKLNDDAPRYVRGRRPSGMTHTRVANSDRCF